MLRALTLTSLLGLMGLAATLSPRSPDSRAVAQEAGDRKKSENPSGDGDAKVREQQAEVERLQRELQLKLRTLEKELEAVRHLQVKEEPKKKEERTNPPKSDDKPQLLPKPQAQTKPFQLAPGTPVLGQGQPRPMIAAQAGGNGDINHRLNEVERKLDLLLWELANMRRDMTANRGPGMMAPGMGAPGNPWIMPGAPGGPNPSPNPNPNPGGKVGGGGRGGQPGAPGGPGRGGFADPDGGPKKEKDLPTAPK